MILIINGFQSIAGIHFANSDDAANGRHCSCSGHRTALYRFEYQIAGESDAGIEREEDDDLDGSVVCGEYYK